MGGLRLLVGALALAATIPMVGGSWRNLIHLVRRPAVWVMAAGSAAFQPLFFGAIERAGVAISTLMAVGAVPVCAGVVGWAVLSHRPTRRWVTATAIAVAGLALRSWGELRVGDPVGVAMALAAAFAVGCYVVATKAEVDRGTHAVELPADAYLLGALLLAHWCLLSPWAGRSRRGGRPWSSTSAS